MMQAKIELTCDLCKCSPRVFDDLEKAQAAGWLEVELESPTSDLFYAHICPRCAKAVESQLNESTFR